MLLVNHLGDSPTVASKNRPDIMEKVVEVLWIASKPKLETIRNGPCGPACTELSEFATSNQVAEITILEMVHIAQTALPAWIYVRY
jgi:hypothetical protein